MSSSVNNKPCDLESTRPLCLLSLNEYTTHTNIQVNLFSACSNTCWTCFRQNCIKNFKSFGQPFYSLQALVNFVKQQKLPRIVISAFGEPTLSRNFVQIVSELSECSSELVVVTNGTTTSKRIFEVLDKLSVISISLHGDSTTHTCTTRNARSFQALSEFRKSLLEHRRVQRKTTRVVSSTLLTRELLNHEQSYLNLLTPSDKVRPSRLLFPTLIASVAQYLNVPSFVETALVLKRFAELDKTQQKPQEDRNIPQCVSVFSQPMHLNTRRYLSNWLAPYCLETCSQKEVCSGISSDAIQFRDFNNLNDELRFVNSPMFQQYVVGKSFLTSRVRIPCLSYEEIALQALRTLFVDAVAFVSPIETYFTAETFSRMTERCRYCRKQTDCDFRLHSLQKFINLPYAQSIYKTQVLFNLLQHKRSQLKQYYLHLREKHSKILVKIDESQKLFADFA